MGLTGWLHWTNCNVCALLVLAVCRLPSLPLSCPCAFLHLSTCIHQPSGGDALIGDVLSKTFSVSRSSSSHHLSSIFNESRSSTLARQATPSTSSSFKSHTIVSSYRASFPTPPPTGSVLAEASAPSTSDRQLWTVLSTASPYAYALLENSAALQEEERTLLVGATPPNGLFELLRALRSGFVAPGSGGKGVGVSAPELCRCCRCCSSLSFDDGRATKHLLAFPD